MQLLDVIHNQHVHLRVERKEVCELVVHVDCVHILCLEPVGRYIEDNQFRELFLDCESYGLGRCLRIADTGVLSDDEHPGKGESIVT